MKRVNPDFIDYWCLALGCHRDFPKAPIAIGMPPSFQRNLTRNIFFKMFRKILYIENVGELNFWYKKLLQLRLIQ